MARTYIDVCYDDYPFKCCLSYFNGMPDIQLLENVFQELSKAIQGKPMVSREDIQNQIIILKYTACCERQSFKNALRHEPEKNLRDI
jgi:hypothetical protein